VTADVESGREEEGLEYLRAMMPELEQIPGLLSGYWLATTKDAESLAMVLFENEGFAQEMAQIGLPNAPQAPVPPSVAQRCGRSSLTSSDSPPSSQMGGGAGPPYRGGGYEALAPRSKAACSVANKTPSELEDRVERLTLVVKAGVVSRRGC
jgi:hypothetical protein